MKNNTEFDLLLRQLDDGIEQMVVKIIDKGYSNELATLFPSSIILSILKLIAQAIILFGLLALIIWNWKISLASIALGMILLWLSGILRSFELRSKIKKPENLKRFMELYRHSISPRDTERG